MTDHFISSTCEGETCGMCGNQATHKIAEEIPFDDPNSMRHEFSTYTCCKCFRRIMGPAVTCPDNYLHEL